MIIVRNQKPPQRKLLIFRLKLNIHTLIEDMAHKAVVEEGVAAVEEQDLVVELIVTVTRTMDNHVITDLVLMVSLQNVLSVNPYFIMLETVLTTRNLLSRNILFSTLPRKLNNVSSNRLYLRL